MAKNNTIKSVMSSMTKAFTIDSRKRQPLPRKGLYAFSNATMDKKQQKQMSVNPATLKRLANTDPITWSIRRTIKSYISQTKWDIVPDTSHIECELDKWEDALLHSINPFGMEEPVRFQSDVLSKELKSEIEAKLDSVSNDSLINSNDKRERIRWLFKHYNKKIKFEAESHKHKVKSIFEHPNNTERSFRALIELVLDDILVYDAGIIVKNYDHFGELAELYSLPGHQIKLYRNEDRTIPEAPETAYAHEDQGVLKAEFHNDELLYILQNQQHNGYGTSPLEVAAYVITAGLYADEYNIDYFKHSNVPPGIINLGPDVSEDQRAIFQKMWDQEVQGRGGIHKLLVTSGSEKLQFVPMRNMSNRDMQMMEYLKWAAAIKCAAYGISPQDIGFVLDFHRTTAEVQSELSQRRGIKSLLNLLQSYFNEEIVKTEFEFDDVKFDWMVDDKQDDIKQSQIDKLDIDTGVISRNERRKKLGMKPIEGGDRYVIATGAGMLPVEDLERVDEPQDQTEQPQNPLQDPNQTNQGLPNAPGANAGPIPQQQIDGDPGRPTIQQGSPSDNSINLSVNANDTEKSQVDKLNSAVEELKRKGINTTIRIGFNDDIVEKDK